MSRQYEHFDTERLNAIPITEVAQALGYELRKAGSVCKTLCPWHEDSHPSLTLYERTNENRCYCFACSGGGSVIDFVMQSKQCDFREACSWLSSRFGIVSMSTSHTPMPKPQPKPKPKPKEPTYTYIPQGMVDELVTVENSLCQCLMRMFNPELVRWAAEEYRIGSYSMNGMDNLTVFPNIDIEGRVCNLKVQGYDTDPQSPRFCHCLKNTTYWLGTMWAKEGRLPKDAEFRSECMFGEHLLRQYPNSLLALVESPKNALFGAIAFPHITWLAVGNKNMLKRSVLAPLRGREVIVIPDRDAIPLWTSAIDSMRDVANFTVSDFCQRMAPPEEPKFDIADYLQAQHPQSL